MSGVSRETDRLEIFIRLLKKWQASINLISPMTLDAIEARHISNCKAILPYIKGRSVVDFGSGGGFPALVIAIMRPDVHVTMIEADQRKCSFLKVVSREINIDTTVINARIEDITPFQTDNITARALAPLPQLLNYAMPYIYLNPKTRLIFMKGRTAEDEMASVDPQGDLSVHIHPNGDGSICVFEKSA